MYRITAGFLGDGDDADHIEITVLGKFRTDTIGFSGYFPVEAVSIRFSVYADRIDAQFCTCPDDPYCDFATVCYKYLIDHRTLNNGWSYSTISPSSTRISVISPEISAWISLKSFIASSMHTTDVLSTLSPTLTY